MDYTVEKANRYIAEHKHLLRQEYRLSYHLMGELGWINDPNGFVQYKGMYHMFYQHYPYKSEWGPMHWGHAVSEDLVTWRHMPIALAPDKPYDRDGCFSGSAIVKDDKLYLMYTGHILTGPDNDRDYKQVQNLAVSEDGIHFTKIADNPVISSDQIPQGVSQKDFRDPKVFEQDGGYYVVLGSNDGQGHGLTLLYRSQDLLQWEYVGILAKSQGEMGDNWECPDFFSLGDQHILMLSPQRMPAQGLDYHNLHSTVYMQGKWEQRTETFTPDRYAPMDYGFDFYAPQSMVDESGRRIVMAWMEAWEKPIVTQQDHHWAGALSLPREMIATPEGSIQFSPIAELKRYRSELEELEPQALHGELLLPYAGDCYELLAVFEPQESEQLGVKLRRSADGEQYTLLSYQASEQLFTLDRDRSGEGERGQRHTRIALVDGMLRLHIFVDRSSVEVFLQQGEKVMTARIYPSQEATGISLFSTGRSKLHRLLKWDLRC
ncbi:glycoside hydrolase family 32 protein [Paenibacillus cisolokensis]|uniref:glycoside hydrolase family 32 protein n=1 Tax=Paenibacillus cisolokensis TaxID=1658519 RepID=UPI003D288C90